jgi:hypothetical protein
MEVRGSAEMAKKLTDLAASSGRAPEEIVEDALAGYLEELAADRKTHLRSSLRLSPFETPRSGARTMPGGPVATAEREEGQRGCRACIAAYLRNRGLV